MDKSAVETIDAYIQRFPEDVQQKLQTLRAAVKAAVPEAREGFSYQMPAFFYKGILVYFAAYRHHIGFYPTPSGIEAFKSEFSGYLYSKGAVQFPIADELPLDLITRIMVFRARENERNEQAR
jgi:uncharacterized protein YdhG (YjbR/CyaY superfamily)